MKKKEPDIVNDYSSLSTFFTEIKFLKMKMNRDWGFFYI